MDNINEWTGRGFLTLLRTAEDRERWRSLTAQASTMTPNMFSHACVLHITRLLAACHTPVCCTSHACVLHVCTSHACSLRGTRLCAARHTPARCTSHTCVLHATRLLAARHTLVCCTSHACSLHVNTGQFPPLPGLTEPLCCADQLWFSF